MKGFIDVLAVVDETAGQSADDASLGLDLPQDQSAGVRGNGPPVESGGHFPSYQGLEIKVFCITLFCHRLASFLWHESFSIMQLIPQRTVLFQ